jgi:hypothetical protein
MGQLYPLHSQADVGATEGDDVASVSVLNVAQCGLCGRSLGADALRFRMVSPLVRGACLTVCHTCRNAALGEGYRPAE